MSRVIPMPEVAFPGLAGGVKPLRGMDSSPDFRRFQDVQAGTLIGGGSGDYPYAIAINPAPGEIYVGGTTGSQSMPATSRKRTANHVRRRGQFHRSTERGFETDPPGDISIRLQYDQIGALGFLPGQDDLIAAGIAESSDFPGTAGGYQPALAGGGAEASSLV